MKFIKKHKIKLGLTLFILLFILFGYFVFTLIFPSDQGDYYGNRLIDINNYEVSKATYEELLNTLKEKEQVADVSTNRSGRIINIIIKVKENIKLEEAKFLTSDILLVFSKEQREYYDLQVFLTIEEETEGYPSIGYKHRTTEGFVWTNNSVQVDE